MTIGEQSYAHWLLCYAKIEDFLVEAHKDVDYIDRVLNLIKRLNKLFHNIFGPILESHPMRDTSK